MTAFAEKYAPKYDKAVDCLLRDRDALLTFFDFPAEHWTHLRTSNPIESVGDNFLRPAAAKSPRVSAALIFPIDLANWPGARSR